MNLQPAVELSIDSGGVEKLTSPSKSIAPI